MNSNHSIYTAPLLRRLCRSALLAASLLVLGACHSSMTPTQEEIDATCPRTVRIMAAVEGYAGSHTGTRAVVNNSSTDHDTFEKLTKEAQGGEKAIRDIFLFVVPEFGSEASQVIYYYRPGHPQIKAEGGKLSGSNVAAKQFVSNDAGEAVMELELKPGRYTFITVANSQTLRRAAQGRTGTVTLEDLKSLTAPNRTFVAHPGQLSKYTGEKGEAEQSFATDPQDFPILGQQVITVPSETPTESLEPVINMERIFARVDLTLTTIDKEGGDYLKSYEDKEGPKTLRRPSDYRLKGMRILATTTASGTSYSFPILPYAGEYTALKEVIRSVGYTSPTILADKGITSNGWEDGSNLSESQAWQKVINNGKDGGLLKLWHKPLFYTSVWNDTDTNPYHLYLPSLYLGQVGEKEKGASSVRIELTFRRLSDSKDYVYRIPLHNEKDAKDYYSIRRNTIYHIDLTFYGDKLIAYEAGGIKVLPWKVEDQTIVVDVDDESGDDQDGVVDDGHGTGKLPGDPH